MDTPMADVAEKVIQEAPKSLTLTAYQWERVRSLILTALEAVSGAACDSELQNDENFKQFVIWSREKDPRTFPAPSVERQPKPEEGENQ